MKVQPCLLSAPALAASLLFVGCYLEDEGVVDDAADETEDGGDGEDAADEVGDEDDMPGEQFECAPDQLDLCPPDTKCTAVTAEDGNSFEYLCVADKGDLLPGEPCTPSPPTGVDGCPSGYACIPDTNLTPTEGHCLQLCLDDDACAEGLCTERPTSPILACADYCDPLLGVCPAPQNCRLLEDRAFGCIYPLPDDIGVQGDQCDGFNHLGCANGFVCKGSFEVPECDAEFCCTAICPVDGMSDCPEPSTCQLMDLDDNGLFENVGFCTL